MRGTGAGRERELAAVIEALEAGRGVVLTGDAGVGKTFIADDVAAAVTGRGWHVVRAFATAGSAELPLAAFAGQLGDHERFLTPVLAEIRDRILEQADGRRIAVVLDDVNLLDDASSALVHQLVSASGVCVVATLRRGEPMPGEFDQLMRRGVITRVAVEPFAEDAIAAVASITEPRPLAPETLELLFRWSRGNPLFVRELLLSAQEEDRLADGALGLVLTEVPVAAPRLLDVIRSRLSHLDERDRGVLLHVAFAEPCGPGELAGIADPASLVRLERAGVVRAEQDGNRLVVRLAHPLYGGVMRAGAGPLERRAVLAALAQALRDTGARRRTDVIKLGRLAVDGGVAIDAGLLDRAAAEAYEAGDFDLCLRIGRRAFEQTGSWTSGWHLSRALVAQSDSAAARPQIDALRSVAVTPAEIVATEALAAEFEYWVAGDLDASLAVRARCDAVLDREDFGFGPVPADDFRAGFAIFLTMSGRVAEAEATVDAVGISEIGPAFIRGTHARANCFIQQARPLDAIAAAESVIEAFSAAGDWGAPLSRRLVTALIALGRNTAGDVRGGLRDSIEARDTATQDLQLAIAALAQAQAMCTMGQARSAAAVLESVSSRWRNVAGLGMPLRWLHAMSAWTHATAGDVDAARLSLAQFDASPHPAVILDVFGEVARARVLIADGRLEAGRAHLRRVADEYREAERWTSELVSRYELVRLGYGDEVASRMGELAEHAQGELLSSWIDHAVQAAAASASGLAAVAERLAAIACFGDAADAASQASDAARRTGDQRDATRLARRAAELRAQCETAGAPLAAPIDAGPVPLTRRERDVAMLAAQGLASKEIGERLFISPRTADNHLARVYDKLGVRSRAELARVFDGGVAALVA